MRFSDLKEGLVDYKKLMQLSPLETHRLRFREGTMSEKIDKQHRKAEYTLKEKTNAHLFQMTSRIEGVLRKYFNLHNELKIGTGVFNDLVAYEIQEVLQDIRYGGALEAIYVSLDTPAVSIKLEVDKSSLFHQYSFHLPLYGDHRTINIGVK